MENTLSETEILELKSKLGTAGLTYAVYNRNLYPYGIPLACLNKIQNNVVLPDQSVTWGSTTNVSLNIIALINDFTVPFTGVTGLLLKNIIEKGLYLSLNQVCVVVVKDYLSFNVEKLLDPSSTRPLLIFDPEIAHNVFSGQAITRGQVFSYNTRKVLVTHSLKDISEHSLFKQEAWQDLKKLNELIHTEK